MNAINKPLPHQARPIPWLLTGINLLLIALVALALAGGRQEIVLGMMAALVGLAVVGYSIFRARFALYMLLAMLPLIELLRVRWMPSSLLVIPGALALLALLLRLALRDKGLLANSQTLLFAVLLGAWATIATLSIGGVFESRPYWLVILLLFLIPNLLSRQEHLLWASWILVLAFGVLGAYVVLERVAAVISLQEISAESLHYVRLEAGGRNIIGMWLTQGMVFVYYMARFYGDQPGKRRCLAICGVMMFAGFVGVLSIGASIGFAVMVLLIAWFQPNLRARMRNFLLGGLLLVAVFGGPLWERIESRQLLTFDKSWGTYRGELWYAGFHTILDHPLFGIGLNPARRSALLQYIDQWFIKNWYRRGILVVPHNSFLSVGVDIGLPGVALYALLLGSLLVSLWRLRRRLANSDQPFLRIFPLILLVALVGGWIQGMGLSVHLDKLMWTLMGLAVACFMIVRQQERLPAPWDPQAPGSAGKHRSAPMESGAAPLEMGKAIPSPNPPASPNPAPGGGEG